MRRTYKVSNTAAFQLALICAYWKERNGSDVYANTIRNAFFKTLNILCEQPYIGRHTVAKHLLVKLLLRRYLIVYQIDTEVINVLAFLDGRQKASGQYRKR